MCKDDKICEDSLALQPIFCHQYVGGLILTGACVLEQDAFKTPHSTVSQHDSTILTGK